MVQYRFQRVPPETHERHKRVYTFNKNFRTNKTILLFSLPTIPSATVINQKNYNIILFEPQRDLNLEL